MRTAKRFPRRDGVGVLVKTPLGQVRAARVALATNAFKPLLRRMSHYIVPVYDYAMVTEPLSTSRWKASGGRTGRASRTMPISSITTAYFRQSHPVGRL